VRRYRVAVGLTQEALAEQAGLSARGLSDLERGVRRAPYADTIQRLAEALHLGPLERSALAAAKRRERSYVEGERFGGRGTPGLPLPLTSFIGRHSELAEVRQLLGTSRLLTLIGAGGVGKTRLALEVAAALGDDYRHGVWLVELAGLADPALVPQVIATTLGMREEAGRPLLDTVADALRPRQLLLLLDNCEHLIEACALVANDLLRICPQLTILATSRGSLGVGGEVTWRVPSMTLPWPGNPESVEQPLESEAVRLFNARAADARPGFKLTRDNIRGVARVCYQLDGIPLAIELAAARLKVLSVEQIADRLDDRLRLLTSGSRTALPRQQTLRGTLDWSYELLSITERCVFNRLAVFAGGWTLEAAETVCAGGDIESSEVLDVLARLVDQSMVQFEAAEDGSVRYRLLETLRHYALEKLQACGAVALGSSRGRHAAFFVGLAESAEPELRRGQQAAWLNRLEREHDNLRQALEWTVEQRDPEPGLRLGGALARFWLVRGYLDEGHRWLDRVLLLPPASTARTPGRAAALSGAGKLAWTRGDYDQADALLRQSLALRRDLADDRGVAVAQYELAMVVADRGDHQAARRLLEQALAGCRALGDRWGTAAALNLLGELLREQGDLPSARGLYEESRSLFDALQDRRGVAIANHNLAIVAAEAGDYQHATALHCSILPLKQELGDREGIACSLINLAGLAVLVGEFQRAARLSGAAEAEWKAIGAALPPYERAMHIRTIESARKSLGGPAFAALLMRGRSMGLPEAIGLALTSIEPCRTEGSPTQRADTRAVLTARESEVAALIARGLTNRQIAEALIITAGTAALHVEHIRAKLGVRSRAQIAAWVVRDH
jgi:predicted ATPase/DNA-binding CsgD family transcriptional regulator/DNA-binding XRE family transcriptional regulator